MSRKKRGPAFARIAITLPPEVLEAADRLASRLDRSRSWVVAEAVRRFDQDESPARAPGLLREPRAGYQAMLSPGLGHLRQAQLEADVRLTPAERVRAAEETARLSQHLRPALGQQLLCFDSPEEYLAWKRREAVGA